MPFYVKSPDGWTKVRRLDVKKPGGTSGTWTEVKRGFIKKVSGWTQFWPQFSPTIDFPLEITRSSAAWPSTLTGKNYHWENADTFTYKFQSSLTDTTDNGAWTDLMSYTTITNPAIGSSNTKTFSITSANFSSTVKSKWFRFVVKAVDTANDITTIEYSNTVNISKTDLVGTPGTVVIERQSSTSYVYSVTNNGTWSSTPESYKYQWQYNLSGTWTNITSGAEGPTTSSITFTSLQSYLDQQIRCQVTAVDDLGALSALPINSNILTVNAAPPGIESFSVTGGVLQVFYSFVVTTILPANQILMNLKLERLTFGTWMQTDSFEVFTKTPTNVSYDVGSSGTYRATLTVNDTVNPIQTSTTANFTVNPISFSNVALNETEVGYTGASNINFANVWLPGDSEQTGAIGWTNGTNMNSTDVTWSGNYNGFEFNKAVSGQGQYVTFPLSETTGNASITANITQKGYGQATASWNQVGAQSYRLVYRITSQFTPGYIDETVTGNNSGSSVSRILPASSATITLRELYVYSGQNQTGRMFPNVEGAQLSPSIPSVNLDEGVQITTTASGTINLITAPTAPTGLSKTAENNGSITFSWSPPTNDGGTPITRYDVMVIQNGVGSYISNGLSTTYTATFSTGNTGVFYVRAVNAWSLGPDAFTENLYIPAILTGPVGTSTTATTTRASWTSYYQSGYSLSLLGNSTYTGTSATHRDISGLSPSTQYPVALSINSVTGNTATQSLSYTITGASTTGSVVTYITNNQLRAGQRVVITGVSPISYNMNATVASATKTSFTINTFVTPGTTYSSGGTASAIINTLAEVPTITTSNITAGGFTANWSASGAYKYYVDIYRSSTGTSIAGYPTYTTLTTSGALTGLVQGASYSISVSSINNIDQASTATVQSITTGAIPSGGSIQWSASNPAIGNTITIGTLNWSPTPTSYDLRIVRGTLGVIRQETTVASTTTSGPLSYVVQPADSGYYFKGFVQASNGFGSSDWINTSEIGPVPGPVLYKVTFTTNGATFGAPSVTSVTQSSSGASVTLATVGTMGKPPFVFGGWTIDGVSYPSGGTYTPTANVNASAIWNASGSAPSTPSGLTNSYSSGPTWTGSWAASSGTGPITYYWTLYQSATVGGTINATASGSTTSTSFTKTMLSADGLWAQFTVYASNSSGTSGTATSGWA
jgi:hypothetical protein